MSDAHSNTTKLTRMANEIAKAFRAQGHDKAVAGAISLSEHELSLLRTLRSQAVMAFKQAS